MDEISYSKRLALRHTADIIINKIHVSCNQTFSKKMNKMINGNSLVVVFNWFDFFMNQIKFKFTIDIFVSGPWIESMRILLSFGTSRFHNFCSIFHFTLIIFLFHAKKILFALIPSHLASTYSHFAYFSSVLKIHF